MTKARDLANAGTALTTVSATELGYLDGVTSAVQTQINQKAATSDGTLQFSILKQPKEQMLFVTTGLSGLSTLDTQTSTFVHVTGSATANFSINFRYNSTTTLDSKTNIGQGLTFSLLNTNGATPYYLTAIQIDGVAQTVKWSGGTAPSAGNASAIDAYSFTIIKTATSTYTVLGAGPIKYA